MPPALNPLRAYCSVTRKMKNFQAFVTMYIQKTMIGLVLGRQLN